MHHLMSSGRMQYCYRHRPDRQRSSEEEENGSNGNEINETQRDERFLQLDSTDQAFVSQIWTLFAASAAPLRPLILDGILQECCSPQLSHLASALNPLLRVDIISEVPTEIAFRILQYLDATSLCHCAQVSTTWKKLADDDVLWHRMCEQHIDKKCTKCGWGLPLLDRHSAAAKRKLQQMQQMGKGRGGACAGQSGEGELGNPKRRRLMIEEGGGGSAEQKEDVPTLNGCSNSLNEVVHSSSNPLSTISCQRLPLPSTPQLSSSSSSTSKTAMIPHAVAAAAAPPAIKRRPWKAIFAERLVVERNWRRGKFKTRILEGHTDGIMCMHYDESKSLLATGSYDHTIRLWNLETNQCIRVLEGHTRCVRGVQFDDTKIVSASMDGTIRIWNLKTGDCMRVLEGQNRQGIVCLHFDDRGLLASGSVDSNISVWNILTGKCFTLTGHTDWVNKVQILNRTQLLSCSDDTTVKMWDLQTRQLLKTFSGHTGQIQCFQAWAAGPSVPVQSSSSSSSTTPPCPTIPTSSSTLSSTQPTSTTTTSAITPASPPTPRCTKSNKLITGSLDSTLRIWSLATGECLKTLFGHMEGVWCVQFDSLRIVSGAHDSTVKIWDVESGALMHDLKGLHRGAVNCCQLTDTKIVTGGDDGVVVVWDFSA